MMQGTTLFFEIFFAKQMHPCVVLGSAKCPWSSEHPLLQDLAKRSSLGVTCKSAALAVRTYGTVATLGYATWVYVAEKVIFLFSQKQSGQV